MVCRWIPQARSCNRVILVGLLVLAAPASAAAALSERAVNEATFQPGFENADAPNPFVLKLQILLDRANASPGVIDGYYGDNVAKAIAAFETVSGLPVDGRPDEALWSRLGGDGAEAVLTRYEITDSDLDYPFVDRIPSDYAEQAEMDHLGFSSFEEMLAERFHMDVDLLTALNGEVRRSVGETILVADVAGSEVTGQVRTIEADKKSAQIRAYDSAGALVVSYPATIGSEENPSPSGVHRVEAIAWEPVYYYRPVVNFQQGDNSEPLNLPPGPNNPVGTVWIDLSEPGYGIHGTPEPAKIDKTASHGCVRLTNWDAEELASLVEPGVTVRFLE